MRCQPPMSLYQPLYYWAVTLSKCGKKCMRPKNVTRRLGWRFSPWSTSTISTYNFIELWRLDTCC